MDPRTLSMEYELEQAHAFLDDYGIDRIDPDTLMILSLRGRLEQLLERARQSEEIL
ncbi:MAG: hypothetical protein KDC38_09330 [Planctomycetes bacterium]|nr:hypothetical protein [Planctomycetota bacterium]